MSVDYYQRQVNSFDKEIAELEKKKAAADKKSADEAKKASSVSIGKNASATTVKSKQRQIDNYNAASQKAAAESADLQKKIADKRIKRNDAYLKLQKEQSAEQKKQLQSQNRTISNMQRSYESRIAELESQAVAILPSDIANDDEVEYDVFVSHATEDKADFVDDFVRELRARNIKVWYDTSEIKWGESMRKKIDEGLRNSRFGIAILSPSYIAEGKYWTKAELDGLFQLDSVNGKALLPIWHNLTKKQVMDYSPIIAGRKAMTTSTMTAGEIAEEFKELLPSDDGAED